MLRSAERGGEGSRGEVRPGCDNALLQSAGMSSPGCPEPVMSVTTAETLAYEVVRAISKPRDGDGLRPSGKCQLK